MNCCKEINTENEEAVANIRNAKSILLICEPFRQNNILNMFEVSKDTHIRNYGFTDRAGLVGYYDIAIIDGASDNFNPELLFNEIYPYINKQVKTFYIYTEND